MTPEQFEQQKKKINEYSDISYKIFQLREKCENIETLLSGNPYGEMRVYKSFEDQDKHFRYELSIGLVCEFLQRNLENLRNEIDKLTAQLDQL